MKKWLVSVVIPTLNREKQVIDCVSSVLESNYKNMEVIIVDNASTDKTVEKIKKKFGKKVELVESSVNLGAGGGRNLGAKHAKGYYLLFLDSDNLVDKRMISNLVIFFEKTRDCGLLGPLSLYKKKPGTVWLYSADINLLTSNAVYKGTGENISQAPTIIETGHSPNCSMVKKSDFNKVGGFDEKYIIMYEEADFAERIKKLGKKVFIYSKAITYHDVPLPKEERDYFINKPKRVLFLVARNRVYFMKKNTSLFNFILFLLIFNPLITLYYVFNLLKHKQFMKALSYVEGSVKGLFLNKWLIGLKQ